MSESISTGADSCCVPVWRTPHLDRRVLVLRLLHRMPVSIPDHVLPIGELRDPVVGALVPPLVRLQS